jgi:hypothetical protein
MLTIEKNAQDLARSRHWFPAEIESDPWIVYHGTSSTAENFIDQHGFRCGSTDLNEAALLCLTIMETTDFWEGPFGALKAYSLPRIRGAGTPPFFCALYPQRTGLYTTKRFAGGETAYALRGVIPELVRVCLDTPEFFAKRFEDDRAKCISKAKKFLLMNRKVLQVNASWLNEKASKLQSFLPGLLDLETRHAYGVVYALRVNPEDVPAMSYRWSDGLRIYDVLPRSRCVAKLIVRGDNELSSCSNEKWHEDNRWRCSAELAKSAELRGRAADPLDLMSEEMLFDPNGAEDFQFKLAAEHGPPQMRELALALAAK